VARHVTGGAGGSRAAHAAWILSVPEEVRPFQGDRAGVVSRLLAGAIDLAVVLVALAAGYLAVAGLLFMVDPVWFRFRVPPRLLVLGLGAVLMVGYLTVSWTGSGRTYGNRVLGLRVVGRHGDRLGPGPALLRAVFCTVLPVGLLWVAVNAGRRSVQDLVLRTVVIYDWSPHAGPPPAGAPSVDAEPAGGHDGGAAGVDAELLVDRPDVGLHRVHRQGQVRGHLVERLR
jgi:uncharacterized RDD family membrane protein YckC